jgi:hypothetical protein
LAVSVYHRAFAVFLALIFAHVASAADWEETVTAGPPGPFRPPRPFTGTFEFGWGDFTAASAEVRFGRSDGHLLLEGSGKTSGMARSLWPFEVTYKSIVDSTTLRPIEVQQLENVRSKQISTHLVFAPDRVSRTRSDRGEAGKTRTFDFPSLFDMHSALLYVRSQPLQEKSVHRIVVYPSTSAYLATITVLGREKLTVKAGTYDAIKLDLQLNKIGKKNELQPHKKFRRGTAWLSDDADRIPLRIEAQIFVGAVFVELQSARFEPAKQ